MKSESDESAKDVPRQLPAKGLRYQCVFCEQVIEQTDLAPCAITLTVGWQGPEESQRGQVFFCHAQCFQERATSYPAIDILSPDWED